MANKQRTLALISMLISIIVITFIGNIFVIHEVSACSDEGHEIESGDDVDGEHDTMIDMCIAGAGGTEMMSGNTVSDMMQNGTGTIFQRLLYGYVVPILGTILLIAAIIFAIVATRKLYR